MAVGGWGQGAGLAHGRRQEDSTGTFDDVDSTHLSYASSQ